ncbi:hypothetical protein [Christiangramia crocea]|uniref:Uncharacterized protein n=1 Tax=Christiangramia crocea TaxID=2904124 RepID=A0A9X1UWP2_9FLAO|nr:hypothetical protein [Gramella crocea]MCG9970879.1 hypothetical protein [Gramella crocea]
MKSLIFGLFLLMSFSMTAQKLSKDAEKLEKDHPEVFMSIKEYASAKWENDPVKMNNEVNEQAEAFSEICKLVIADFYRNRLTLEILKQRTEDDKKISFIDPSVNWEVVLSELRQSFITKRSF